MATTSDYFKSGVENAVSGMISRIGNDYREGYGLGNSKCKKVMREAYKFLSVLQTSLTLYRACPQRGLENKYVVFDTAKEFAAYMKSEEFLEMAECSKLGIYHVMTPHMVEVLEWLCEFADTLLNDTEKFWTDQIKIG